MGLHLNLYHEIAKEKRLKSRDPLKLSMIGLGFIGALFAGYYFVQLGIMSGINHEFERKTQEFNLLDPQAKTAVKREEEVAANRKTTDVLVKRIEGRFYWGPLLEEITKIVPPTLQLNKLIGEVNSDTKRCMVTLDGIASGTDPRKSAEELRTALAETLSKNYREVSAAFRSLEDAPETARLNGKLLPTAVFTINVQFTAGEKEGAPVMPPPRAKKR